MHPCSGSLVIWQSTPKVVPGRRIPRSTSHFSQRETHRPPQHLSGGGKNRGCRSLSLADFKRARAKGAFRRRSCIRPPYSMRVGYHLNNNDNNDNDNNLIIMLFVIAIVSSSSSSSRSSSSSSSLHVVRGEGGGVTAAGAGAPLRDPTARGGTTCLTLLVYPRFSSKVVNSAAN